MDHRQDFQATLIRGENKVQAMYIVYYHSHGGKKNNAHKCL